MDTRPDALERIAESPEELRRVLAGSRLDAILPLLRLEPYFPRSTARLLAEERRTRAGMQVLWATGGLLIASAALSLWRLSPYPFAHVVLAAVPLLMLARRLMGSIFGETSEAQRYIELMCLDRRKPVVYLRRFEGEDPPLPALTSANSVVGAATNPAGTSAFENLAQLLDAIGPVVGLGRPSDSAIAHRIYRLYTPDEHWQAVVQHLLRDARAVLMSYEPGPILDWELDQALASDGTVLFLVLRNLPEAVVRSEAHATAALPSAVRRLARPQQFTDAVSDKYPTGEYGLLAVVEPTALRIYGIKVHFQQLWDLIFTEFVHKQRLNLPTTMVEAPAAYRPLVRAVNGSHGWIDVLAFAAGIGAVAFAWWLL